MPTRKPPLWHFVFLWCCLPEHFWRLQTPLFLERENGRDLTQSYDKSPYTHRDNNNMVHKHSNIIRIVVLCIRILNIIILWTGVWIHALLLLIKSSSSTAIDFVLVHGQILGQEQHIWRRGWVFVKEHDNCNCIDITNGPFLINCAPIHARIEQSQWQAK